MPTVTGEKMLAVLDRFEEIDISYAASRTTRLAIFDRKEQRRHAIGIDQARSNDTLHSLMPTFAKDHKRALTRIALRCLFLSNLGKLSLDAAALVVVVFELRCKAHAFRRIVAEEQIERKLGIAHAPCRIESRNERESKVHRTQGAGLYACLDHERFDAGTRFAVEHCKALCNECAILIHHGHKIGDRAQRCQIDQVVPKMRLAQSSP